MWEQFNNLILYQRVFSGVRLLSLNTQLFVLFQKQGSLKKWIYNNSQSRNSVTVTMETIASICGVLILSQWWAKYWPVLSPVPSQALNGVSRRRTRSFRVPQVVQGQDSIVPKQSGSEVRALHQYRNRAGGPDRGRRELYPSWSSAGHSTVLCRWQN